jgi:hypothetical protein
MLKDFVYTIKFSIWYSFFVIKKLPILTYLFLYKEYLYMRLMLLEIFK